MPGQVNSTFTYIGPLQRAVFVLTHCTDVILENISIDKCSGFGLLFINPLGNTVIRELSVTETAYGTGLTECWGGGRSDMLCSGSGAVVVFDDTNITDQLVKVGRHPFLLMKAPFITTVTGCLLNLSLMCMIL